MKKIPNRLKDKVEKEIKNILHAHRDCLRNQGKDTLRVSFNIMDGYYGEAFGIMRALQIMGYGEFGSDNIDGSRWGGQPEQNLKWWFRQLEDQVLEEEGFNSDHHCEHCVNKYRKDDRWVIQRGQL